MKNFSIEHEWLDIGPVRANELRETSGELSIRVRGKPITLLVDERSNSVRTSLFIPLYPLAEWFVSNWWPLLFEGITIVSPAPSSWRQRHNLISASEGYALPHLEVWREGKYMRLQWRPHEIPNARLRFLAEGHVKVPFEDFRTELCAFVGSVVNRLGSRSVRETFLEQEWAAIQNISEEEIGFCESAGVIGIDPFDVQPEIAAVLEAADEKFAPSLLTDYLRSAKECDAETNFKWILENVERVRQHPTGVARLRDLRQDFKESHPYAPPWKRGYLCAESFRDLLAFESAAPPVSLDAMLGEKNILSAGMINVASAPLALDGLLGISRSNTPMVLTQKRRLESQRFAFCRALYQYAYSGDDYALLTKARDDRQKSNRAFAAELLAPEGLLKDRLSAGCTTPDEIDDIAAAFQVSPWIIRYQIRNHHLAEIVPSP
ncbi:MAG: ImmA/IrrE family metallo-endopeptidase [Planctomycetaceae bacterium]